MAKTISGLDSPGGGADAYGENIVPDLTNQTIVPPGWRELVEIKTISHPNM